ncbi:CD209 antigen-like protein D [Mustelus asterias]
MDKLLIRLLVLTVGSNYHQLQAKHSQLEEGLNNLQAKYSQLEEGLNNLQAKYSQLEEGHNSLRANYSQLEQRYKSLQAYYSQLEEGLNNLQAKYSQLEHDYSRQNKSCGQLLVGTRELLNTLVDECINTCPRDWSEFNKTCYYFSTEMSDWHGANNSCAANNSTLAIVTTESQQNLIANHDSEKRWIGLTDLDQVGVYVWVNGEQLRKGFWARGEPNNPGVERCIVKGGRYHPNKWNNDLCSARHRWICQTSLFEYLARRFGLEAFLRQ